MSVTAEQAPDWGLQALCPVHPENGWLTFHVYAGDRDRPTWPPSQAARLRREGYKLRTVRLDNNDDTGSLYRMGWRYSPADNEWVDPDTGDYLPLDLALARAKASLVEGSGDDGG